MEPTRTDMPAGVVYVEREPPIARVVFNLPAQNNPMSEEWRTDVEAAMELLRNDMEVAVVIIKGNGRGLSSGGDLNFVMQNFGGEPYEDRQNCLRLGRYLYRVLWQFPKPIVLQAHGFLLGGSIALMAISDIVVVEEDALIGTPETRTLGFEPFMGFWAMNLGARWTQLLLYTGDVIDGKKAEAIGMVTKAVPSSELEAYVEWIAARIAKVGAEVLCLQKEAIHAMYEIGGLEAMVKTTMVYNHQAHYTARAKEWRRRLREDGIKAAVAWRDEPFGGPIKRGGPLPLLEGPKGTAASTERVG
jgi:enoyl-CoA hydratase/carnithine racemase